jgi:hypothetical protein
MKTLTNFAAIEARSTYHGSCKRYLTGSRPDLNVPTRMPSITDPSVYMLESLREGTVTAKRSA